MIISPPFNGTDHSFKIGACEPFPGILCGDQTPVSLGVWSAPPRDWHARQSFKRLPVIVDVFRGCFVANGIAELAIITGPSRKALQKRLSIAVNGKPNQITQRSAVRGRISLRLAGSCRGGHEFPASGEIIKGHGCWHRPSGSVASVFDAVRLASDLGFTPARIAMPSAETERPLSSAQRDSAAVNVSASQGQDAIVAATSAGSGFSVSGIARARSGFAGAIVGGLTCPFAAARKGI